jgi:hypothetical protein
MPACFAASVKATWINLFDMRKAAGNGECKMIYHQTNSAITVPDEEGGNRIPE